MLEIDSLRVNLRLDGVLVRELFEVNWRYESGLVTNIEQMVEEYRQIRGLEVQHCLAIKSNIENSTNLHQIDVTVKESKRVKLRRLRLGSPLFVPQWGNSQTVKAGDQL